jgi:hypothetical protein
VAIHQREIRVSDYGFLLDLKRAFRVEKKILIVGLPRPAAVDPDAADRHWSLSEQLLGLELFKAGVSVWASVVPRLTAMN